MGGDDTATVQSIIAMPTALGTTVTAEGVETLEQLSELRTLGCKENQGFYFARPQPADMLIQLLTRGYVETPRARAG